jgi:membrane-bound serine protease (ClpP class)
MRRKLLLMLGLLSLAVPATGQSPVVYRIAVSGTVENGLAPYVARGLREAEAAGAAAAYLDIDTPGGRVDAAERISDAIRRAGLPVYAFVNPRAFSAGALIAISAREVYMRPGAVLGAATPVDGGATHRSSSACGRSSPMRGPRPRGWPATSTVSTRPA